MIPLPPGKYADAGIPAMIEEAVRLGASETGSTLSWQGAPIFSLI